LQIKKNIILTKCIKKKLTKREKKKKISKNIYEIYLKHIHLFDIQKKKEKKTTTEIIGIYI
jgi:hypothetical protein